jgi:hypothetical protein
MYKFLLVFFLVISSASLAMAQEPVLDAKPTNKDSVNASPDSLTKKRFAPKVTHDDKLYHPDSLHSPHKAVMRSLMVPGWGQIYNHQWWKVPFIYAGLGLLMDAIIFNQRNYAPNLVVAHYYEQGQTLQTLPKTAKDYDLFATYQSYNVPQQSVYDLVDSYRRDRDLCILGFLGGWGIQMVDAYIDAKFQHSYTMDTDFSFKIEPTIMNQQPMYAFASGSYIPGLKLTIGF